MIKVLDSFVADKIAAGEVIERPVSAVKELIENSIDAGARTIITEIRNGGKSYIRVTDDGCGISFDETETAFLRHATSKISSVTDLDGIVSLGFRGEALASISAVSRLTMVTRTADSPSGAKIVLHGGRVVSKERTGANTGTTVIVEDLFYNTPARRKFMKSDAREASSIIELIQQYAVCYADIRFMMINNGQTLFSASGDGDALSVIKTLYPDLARYGLIPVSGDDVNGYVSDPGRTMNTRKGQLFFVNGRLVSSNVIEKAVEEGYGGRIFSGFPAAVLFIEAEPDTIDVNIHPGKREIRFLRQNEIRQSVSDAVRRAVMTDAGVPKGFVKNIENTERESLNNNTSGEQASIREFLSSLGREEKREEKSEPSGVAETPASDDVYVPVSSSVSSASASYPSSEYKAVKEPAPFDFDDLTFKGYVFDTYIIMQGRDELYIFDQHAAHERVFYEKFMRGYNDSSHSPQPLLTAFTISVSPDVYSMSREWLDDLARMGYDIEDFGERTFIVRGIPAYMEISEAEGFAAGYAEAAGEAGGANRTVIDKLIMRSCKSVVKAHDRLSEMEILDLMKKLSDCENPFSCPHGRPTFIRVSAYEIERSFKRK
ncbi:MAG: DNA mismatch repair endonuclease MutL [Mogibacterium sp.]|nr:DNA mismatch repair endonuclease MutL [Mogibacterium sp.]